MSEPTNIVVMNQGLNPLVSYNFMLRVEGVFDLPCKSVHSFKKENEYEYIQEGGLNDYVHMRRKPISKPFTFTVERYVGTDYYDPLHNGAELILPVILLVSRYNNHFGVTKRAYVFTGCTVMSKEYGELNSEKSGLHTETIVIGYREMMVVTNPVDIGIGNWMDTRTEKDTSTKVKFAREDAINKNKPKQGSWIRGRKEKDTSTDTEFAKEYENNHLKPKQGNWMDGRKEKDSRSKNKYAKTYTYDNIKPKQGNWMEKKGSAKSIRNVYAKSYRFDYKKAEHRKWPTVSSAITSK